MPKGFSHERGYQGATNVWLTPPEIISDLGPFDLDPCASVGQPWRTAAKQYTEEDDGLSKVWEGFVWCNPPYGPEMKVWIERMAKYGSGIVLTFARTETRAFFDYVWGIADAIKFLRGRVRFHRPDGTMGESAGAPSVLIAYGKEAAIRLEASKTPGFFVRLKEEAKP